MMEYEIAVDTKDMRPQDIDNMVVALFWAGYNVYHGIDGQICFKMNDDEVTEIKGLKK